MMMFLRFSLLLLTLAILLNCFNSDAAPSRQKRLASPEASMNRPFVFKVPSPLFWSRFIKSHWPTSTLLAEMENLVSDFEDPEAENSHDADKRQFDDYGHLRFGKRSEFDDYGHLRFGRSLN